MRNFFALAPLAGFAAATVYSAHTDHTDVIDQVNSTKSVGIVKWQYFFDKYVLEEVIGADPTNYEATHHLCWFKFNVEQWYADTSVDERYAITAHQNCPAALIDHFDFDITIGSSNNYILWDKSTD